MRPVLPGPRLVPGDTIDRAGDGWPKDLVRRVVLDCPVPRDAVRQRHPALHEYLAEGERRGIDQRYLPRHRHPWYAQERRPPAPILCTYMGRRRGGRLIRFIRNHSDATATNVYHLLYPRPGLDAELMDRIFAGLREIADTVQTASRSRDRQIRRAAKCVRLRNAACRRPARSGRQFVLGQSIQEGSSRYVRRIWS